MDSKYRNRRTGASGQQVDQADRCEHLTGSASGFVDTSSFVAFAILALASLPFCILRWCIRWQKGHLLGHLLPFTCCPPLRVGREAWSGHMGTWSHGHPTWAQGPLGQSGPSHSRHPRHLTSFMVGRWGHRGGGHRGGTCIGPTLYSEVLRLLRVGGSRGGMATRTGPGGLGR